MEKECEKKKGNRSKSIRVLSPSLCNYRRALRITLERFIIIYKKISGRDSSYDNTNIIVWSQYIIRLILSNRSSLLTRDTTSVIAPDVYQSFNHFISHYKSMPFYRTSVRFSHRALLIYSKHFTSHFILHF